MVKNQKSAHHAQKKPTKRKTTPEKIVSNSVRNRLTHDSESIAHTSNLFEIIAEAIDIDTKEGHLFLEQMEQLSWTYPILKRTPCSFQTCPKCSELYEAKEKIPICLPCGHTFCNTCLKNCLITPGRGQCPFDKKEFFSLIDFLPVNFALIMDIEEAPRRCSTHKLILIGYCRDCSRLICGRCMFDHRNHECFDVDSEQATQMADSNFELIEVLEGKLVDLKESWSRGFDLLKAYLGTIGSFIKKIEEDGPQIKDLKPELGVGNEIVSAEIKKLAEILNVEFAALITKITECLGKHVGILNDYKTNFKRMTIHDRLGFCLEHHINLNIAPKSLKGVETLYNLFTPIFNIPPSSEPACK